MAAINPYLTFDGKAEEAFNFYKSVFGGEFPAVMKFGEMPGCEEMQLSDSDKGKIMHIALPIGDGNVLMGSDHFEGMGPGLTIGNNFGVAIDAKSKEEADTLFNGLSEGGTVTLPLADAFWGAYFGMFTDKFGINWMVNHSYPKNQ